MEKLADNFARRSWLITTLYLLDSWTKEKWSDSYLTHLPLEGGASHLSLIWSLLSEGNILECLGALNTRAWLNSTLNMTKYLTVLLPNFGKTFSAKFIISGWKCEKEKYCQLKRKKRKDVCLCLEHVFRLLFWRREQYSFPLIKMAEGMKVKSPSQSVCVGLCATLTCWIGSVKLHWWDYADPRVPVPVLPTAIVLTEIGSPVSKTRGQRDRRESSGTPRFVI